MARRARIVGLAIAALAVFAVAGVAVAAMDDQPRTEEVLAQLTFVSAEGKERFCIVPDGEYREAVELVRLNSTGDPRLTGVMEFRFRSLDNFTKAIGTADGKVVIRDGATGRKKAEGRFSAVNVDAIVYGFITAHVNEPGLSRDDDDDDEGKGATLLAHLRFNLINGTGQIGGEWTDPGSPALVQSGRCSGPFQRFSF